MASLYTLELVAILVDPVRFWIDFLVVRRYQDLAPRILSGRRYPTAAKRLSIPIPR